MTESTQKKTVAPREPHLTGEVLESARAGQQSASDAVRKFTKAVDDALRERREAIREDSALHSLRTTIVDAAIELADQLVTAQYEFLRSVVRSADRALSKPDEEK